MKLVEITGELIGAKHTPAGRSRKEGFDCLTSFVRAAQILEQELPDQFGEFKIKDYAERGVELWNKDRRKATLILIRFLRSLGKQIEPKDRLPGDIVIVKILDMKKSIFGILAGTHQIIYSSEEGNKILDLEKMKHKFKEVIRWNVDCKI